MEIDEDEYNTHFAVNQVIELKKWANQREKSQLKKRDLQKGDLSSDDDDEILYDKDKDKLIIEDSWNAKKKASGDASLAAGKKRAWDDESDSDSEEIGNLKEKLKSIRKRKKIEYEEQKES